MAKSNDTPLKDILKDIHDGKIRLPDFQRGWVWDDTRIRTLIASITCSYPIGAVMFLECGGDGISFRSRPFTNVTADEQPPEVLVLDGQQRLTSIYCALYGKDPVPTLTTKQAHIARYYYLDMAACLDADVDRLDAVISVPADRKITESFGHRLILDLSTREGEFRRHLLPLNLVFDSIALDEWKDDYRDFHGDAEISKRLRRFTAEILNPVISYTLPVIALDKATPKEAVCQVFEHVNTGGVPLTVFELMTATFAADNFGLRDDWERRRRRMQEAEGTFNLLSAVAATDFLQAMTLLAQKRGNRTLTVKRKDVLSLPLADYQQHADDLTCGFIRAARFLVQQSILAPRDLPYTTQLVPLSVLMTVIGSRAEDGTVKEKLAQWYWCGVFGEMYGGANETRYVTDVSGVLSWLAGGAEPDTVSRAFFQPTRLLSLQTRNGAAYKGLMALILQAGACDFISGAKMDFTNFVLDAVDIHHVFPRKYCETQGFNPQRWDSIVNKTPLTYRTNRIIGGDAPSKYLRAIEKNVPPEKLTANVRSHLLDADALRRDDFDQFFVGRAKALLNLISRATGKPIGDLDSTETVTAFGKSLA